MVVSFLFLPVFEICDVLQSGLDLCQVIVGSGLLDGLAISLLYCRC